MKYALLVDVYQKLESTTKRLEKTLYLSEFLKKVNEKDLDHVLLLLEGRVFPASDPRKVGMASRLLLKAISTATGASVDSLEKEWKKTGNLGDVAANVAKKKRQATLFSKELTTKKVFENLQKLSSIEGKGTVDIKIKYVVELLTSATPDEARYIVRTILEDLRVGVAGGTFRDAIVWAFFTKELGIEYDQKKNALVLPDKNRKDYTAVVEAVQKAYDLTTDFAQVVLAARKGLDAVKKIKLLSGKPVNVMLYKKVEDIKEAFKVVGTPAAVEYKFDGFRLQIHKKKGVLKLYTRRLEEMTKQFPDVIKVIEESVKGDDYILDAEAVGIDPKTKKYIAFQMISQRIKRKYDIDEVAKKFPVEVNIFDIMFHDGESLLKKPFKERRNVLEKMMKKEQKHKIKLANQIVTGDVKKAQAFYQKSLDEGHEGVMVKNLEGIYKPGSRVGYGVKIKPTLQTLEVVVVGAEWGEGKRSKWMSSFVIAVRDADSGDLLEVGRVGSGFKEKKEEGFSFGELTELLKPLVTKEKAKSVEVKPKIVIEVDYEEIQKSPKYKSGYALRFPRFVRLRDDRGPRDASTTNELQMLYNHQRGRGS